MSWESFDWKPADGASLGAGASILPLWGMLRSAIAEGISADALCPVTIGELTVGHVAFAETPTPLLPTRSFELLGTDRRGAWGALDPDKGDKIGGNVYTADRLQELVLEALDGAFEAMLGEGLGLGKPVDSAAPDAPMLLLRLPITSVDNEELVLISAYDEAVAGELSAHIVALQALSAEAASTPPPAATPVSMRPQEFKAPASPTAARPAAVPAPAPAPAPVVPPVPAPLPANVRQAHLPELTGSPTGTPGYNIDLLLGVTLQVAVEIGRTTLPIRDVLALTPGSIIELDKLAGEKVDILINGRPIAQGEIVVVDENFGVRITDVVARTQRLSPSGRWS
ncbi:MAG TPA: flagellar motor switch protein FliN [Candidatus Limnocylindrales bacterium]|jgi:flagellar motor switch protein FliN